MVATFRTEHLSDEFVFDLLGYNPLVTITDGSNGVSQLGIECFRMGFVPLVKEVGFHSLVEREHTVVLNGLALEDILAICSFFRPVFTIFEGLVIHLFGHRADLFEVLVKVHSMPREVTFTHLLGQGGFPVEHNVERVDHDVVLQQAFLCHFVFQDTIQTPPLAGFDVIEKSVEVCYFGCFHIFIVLIEFPPFN